MKFTVYKEDTGEVVFSGTADKPLELVGAGQAVFIGEAFDSGYFDNGFHNNFPDRPSPFHNFDFREKCWIDSRTIDDAKRAKNEEINNSRLRANQSSFTFAGKEVSVDPLSRSDIDAAHGAWLLNGGPPPNWPGGWKAEDNSIIPIPDMETWAAFYGAMVGQGTQNYLKAQQLKAQLAAATTIEEVESIKW